jgi:acetolactate synthase-1/3 small subunit
MTIVSDGDEKTLEQIKKQLNKLIDVIKVADFKEGEFIDRELVLVRVAVNTKNKKEVIASMEASGARVVGAGSKSVSIEASGSEKSVRSLLEAAKPFGILEVVRTGRIAMGTEDRIVKAGGKPEVNE